MGKDWETVFGEYLQEKDLITGEELSRALASRSGRGEMLRQALLGAHGSSPDEVLRLLGESTGIPCIDLGDEPFDEEALKLIPASVIRKHNVIPFKFEDEDLVVACEQPLDVSVQDVLAFTSGHEVRQVLADPGEIARVLESHSGGDSLENWVREWDEELLEFVDRNREVDVAESEKVDIGEGDVVKMVSLLVTRAIKEDASDIHFEPQEGFTRVRFRIDGLLRQIVKVPDELHQAIVTRIKVLSELDIAERRMPQDGAIFVKFKDKEVDLRVSTSPTIYGESVSLRLLDQSKAAVCLEDLGMEADDLAKTLEALDEPHGFVLSTGPTGCGKTTTMYAMLNRISDIENRIVTIEDPVEYRLDLINQIAVNYAIGLDFARILRSVLRQDPNIILVGEIRDPETAHVAVQAALTGHLLLSTLHTNNAPETLLRLVEIGIEPYYVREVVKLTLAQRLVRKLCPVCREEYAPPASVLEELGLEGDGEYRFFKAVGCPECGRTGYRGRTGVFEVMPMTEELKEMMTLDVPMRKVKEAAARQGMRNMWGNAALKVAAGVTSVEEIRRQIPR